jgi:hypothetical protein
MTNREIAAELFIRDKTASVHVSADPQQARGSETAPRQPPPQRIGVRRESGGRPGNRVVITSHARLRPTCGNVRSLSQPDAVT